VPEFYTTVQFRPDVMYFIMVVEEEYAVYKNEYDDIDYFEDWDDDDWDNWEDEYEGYHQGRGWG
jgi:hypothetical protein